MKRPKLVLAYLSIPLFLVYGTLMLLSLFNPQEGIEGQGILLAVLSGLSFFAFIILGVISIVLDVVKKSRQIPLLSWILLIFPVLNLLLFFGLAEEKVFKAEAILLVVCCISIGLLVTAIRRSNRLRSL